MDISAPRHPLAHSLPGQTCTCRRAPLLHTSFSAMIFARLGAGATGPGQNSKMQCFAHVLPTVLPIYPAKSWAYPSPKTVKRRSATLYMCVHARARVRAYLFPCFTVLDIYQDIENKGKRPKTLPKTGPKKCFAPVLPRANPLKTNKKGVF